MKKLKLYNTMKREKEIFSPILENSEEKDFVWIYSCWPTVYRHPHIWNMRAFIFADLIRNTIKNILWYPLIYVMNLTDVWHLTDDWNDWEDKMEKWAKKENLTVWELSEKYISSFYNYLDLLNIEKFDVMPKASDHIVEQIELVKNLEKKWFVYVIENDGIYMDTSKVKDYGKLSNLENQSIMEWARIKNDNKKNPTDFALWKFSPKWVTRQMERDSPRGKWFPWWHIECSAMATKYLWKQFDIHTGWVDHIWVHHTNEIAQSECGYWVNPWVKYWLHNQFLNLGWKKMAKSEWWLITVSDIVDKWFDSLSLRYFYFKAHYRSFQDFDLEKLSQSEVEYNNLLNKLSKNTIPENNFYWIQNYEEFSEKYLTTEYYKSILDDILDNLLDDFNITQVLSIIQKELNKNEVTKELLLIIFYMDEKILKLNLKDKIKSLQEEKKIKIPEEITELGEKRLEAKNNKNWETADKIRDQINQLWYKIIDEKDWFKIEKRK